MERLRPPAPSPSLPYIESNIHSAPLERMTAADQLAQYLIDPSIAPMP